MCVHVAPTAFGISSQTALAMHIWSFMHHHDTVTWRPNEESSYLRIRLCSVCIHLCVYLRVCLWSGQRNSRLQDLYSCWFSAFASKFERRLIRQPNVTPALIGPQNAISRRLPKMSRTLHVRITLEAHSTWSSISIDSPCLLHCMKLDHMDSLSFLNDIFWGRCAMIRDPIIYDFGEDHHSHVISRILQLR